MSSLFSRRSFLAGSLLTPFALAGCGGGGGSVTPSRSVVITWNQALLNAIIAVKPGPPITARAIGIVHTAIYDAWSAYDAVALGTQLGSQLRRPATERTLANKQKAVSYSAYRALVDLFASQKASFDAVMQTLGYDPTDASTDTTPQGVGNRASAALIAFRHNDGSNQLNNYADTTGYVPVNTPDKVVDPSQWQQLRFANGASPAYIAPHWGNVIPFALSSPSVDRPPTPPVYGTPTYLAQVQEIVDLTANLNDTTKSIAEYWALGPGTIQPPGIWAGTYAQYISQTHRYGLDDDVRLFFIMGNAVMDAGIACWECKRVFNTSRPITAIRALYAGQQIPSFAGPGNGIQIVDGSQWTPYQSVNFITPPFPEYTSGHSTFSAASAEVLKRYTGSDNFAYSVTIPSQSSSFEPGVPAQPVLLSWATFSAAADQAGISRRYGGIHFQAGDIEGRACGRTVGGQVWDMAMSYITGAAPSRVA
jgi:hypothetical protein